MANENNENKVNPNLSDITNESENADPTGELTPGSLVEEQVEPAVGTSETLEHNQGDNSDEIQDIDPTSDEMGNSDPNEQPGTESSEAEQVISEENIAEDSPDQNTEAASALKTTKETSLLEQEKKLEKELVTKNELLKQEVANLKEQVAKTNQEREESRKENESLKQEVESLKEQVAKTNQEIEELREENDAKDREIERLKDPLLMLINKKLQEQKTDFEKDLQELAGYSEQVHKWTIRNQTLHAEINSAVENSNNILSQSQEAKNKLPEPLQEKLQKRQEGLNLIGKMLTRLQEQIGTNIEDPAEPEELPMVSEQELRGLFDSESDEELGKKAIAKRLKEVGTQRWKIISQRRDLAEKLRKKWLNIIDKKILPIIDGIDDGQKFSENLIQELKAEKSEQATELNNWFETYSLLQEMFLKMLQLVKVYPMEVPIGQPIDFNLHEPFDVQSDPSLNNEDIKEVTRQGYKYEPEAEGQEMLVLRSAQVVVVKNN